VCLTRTGGSSWSSQLYIYIYIGSPIIDRHDRIFPKERHRIAPTQGFLGLLITGEGARGHEILHHATVLELVLDGIHVVQAGLLEKSLEVVYQRPCLALTTMRSCSDTLHVGVGFFLVIAIVIVSCGCNPLRMPLSPLLAALGVLDGGVGWCRFAATGDPFPTA
jgi:hypothetical protein